MASSDEDDFAIEPPLPPPQVDIWNPTDDCGMLDVDYVVSRPWKWVMENLRLNYMTDVGEASALPSASLLEKKIVDETPRTRSRRRNQQPRNVPATLMIEVRDKENGNSVVMAHGSSAALDGLEDKDELIRTMQRCRCTEKQISPPSVLINWDVTHEECLNIVGKDLPVLESNNLDDKFVVLKEPMGSQGKGIFFVRTAEEIHAIIEKQRQQVVSDPGFMDQLIAVKRRIPSWVLQAEVHPCLLVRDRRKFHIRSYVTVVEKLFDPELVDVYVYNGHEVRLAGHSVPENETSRDPVIHITNGALSKSSERLMLCEVDELTSNNFQSRLELFIARTFGLDLVRDIAGRVRVSAPSDSGIVKFAVAGLDLMVTADHRIYLLEVNTCPAAPRESTVTGQFKEHLKGFMKDMTCLVTGAPSSNFMLAKDILAQT